MDINLVNIRLSWCRVLAAVNIKSLPNNGSKGAARVLMVGGQVGDRGRCATVNVPVGKKHIYRIKNKIHKLFGS